MSIISMYSWSFNNNLMKHILSVLQKESDVLKHYNGWMRIYRKDSSESK